MNKRLMTDNCGYEMTRKGGDASPNIILSPGPIYICYSTVKERRLR